MPTDPLDVAARMNVLMLGVQFFIDQPAVTDLLDNISRTHAVGPILYPTEYRNGMHNLEWQETVLRAVDRFQKELAPIRAALAELASTAVEVDADA